MKWLKHYSDAYTNLKLRVVINEFGMEGYGFFWLCLELVAQQGGDNFELSTDKLWKNALLAETRLEEEKIEKLLTRFAEIKLIDKKSLNKGVLSVPKIREYVDEYTDKVWRKSRQYPDRVRQEKSKRESKSREEKEKEVKDFKTNF